MAQDQGAAYSVSGEGSLPCCRWCLLAVSSYRRRGKEVLCPHTEEGARKRSAFLLCPHMEEEASKCSKYEFWTDTNIQSIAR